MPKQSVVKKGSSRKVGGKIEKCRRYRERGTCMFNKIKRILQSNGPTAAKSYRRDQSAPFPKEGGI